MTHLESLVAARQSAWKRYQEIRDAADAEKRDLTTEEDANLAKINEDLDSFDARIKKEQELQARAALVDGVREQYSRIIAASPEAPKGEPSERDMLRAMLNGERRGFEAHVSEGFESRALSSSADTVPTSFADFVVTYQRTLNPTYGLATVIRTSNGEGITIPRVTADPAVPATPFAEAATLSAVDPTISSISLNAYKYGSITLWSAELGQDNAVNLESLVATATGRDLGIKVGAAFTTGDGSSKPNGFITAATNGGTATKALSGGTAGTFFGPDDMLDLKYSLAQPYRLSPSTAWQLSNSAIKKARTFKDANGQYLWQPSLQIGQPDQFDGHPVFENPAMAAVASASKSVAFGDFAAYHVREVTPMAVAISTEYKFDTDQIAIKTTWRVDGDLPDVAAIAYLVSAGS